ncbi:pentatricopeptide repeat-containing protein At4g21705, mitochondrial-like [Primulina eburnea]|uniref:pentatricopeptide repeat-containing protein At4g21705, mitochondrial-like n=1 Tax=Primulina eburnea TaxID=1245227 RepID=UPI003C6C2B1C
MLRNSDKIKAFVQAFVINSRCYYTKNKQKKISSLYEKISPLGNPSVDVTRELDTWVGMGNKIRFAELQRIILDLRKRRRFNHALQVSEWTKNSGMYTLTPVQHAVQLDLIGKVHGFLAAENYFNGLNEQDRTEKAYGALLHCYVRGHQTEKVFAHLQAMKEKGIALASVAYNDIMSLYSNIGEIDKVPNVLDLMKKNGVQPNNLSYRICINSYGVRSDIDGVEKILSEMESQSHIVMDWNTYAVVANFYAKAGLKDKANFILRKAEGRLENKDGLGYNHLISLHAGLGNRDDVFRLWDLEKNACKRCLNKDYINIMDSLVRLEELEEAEKVLKEWESSGNCYDFRVPNVVIAGHIEKGLCEKAGALLEYLMETGKTSTSNIWARLAAGYMEKDEMEKALSAMKVATSLCDVREGNTIQDTVIGRILSLFGEKGSSDATEDVVDLLRSVMSLNRQMYHTLLKSNISGGKEVNRLLDIMKTDGFEEDEETKRILAMWKNGM